MTDRAVQYMPAEVEAGLWPKPETRGPRHGDKQHHEVHGPQGRARLTARAAMIADAVAERGGGRAHRPIARTY